MAHPSSHVKPLSAHTDPYRPTQIHILLSSTHTETSFCHTDPYQYISTTTNSGGGNTCQILPPPHRIFQKRNAKITSFLQQFSENCKDGNDMARLEVVMRLEIKFFLVIVTVYILMGLVLQVVNPFMPDGNKRSKSLK